MFTKIIIASTLAGLISLFITDYRFCFEFVNAIFAVKNEGRETRLFYKDELKEYNGVERPELYLVILGKVYNVTKGNNHYGPNQAYHVFVGQDASKSFVTGKFESKHISDDVASFSKQELRSLNHWVNFYKKEYPFVGKLIGRYYDEKGGLTAYGKVVKKLIRDAEKEDENMQIEKMKFPPCNVEWNPDNGTRVWCTKKSGGIQRDWAGVPRQYYEVTSKTYRCACVAADNAVFGNLREYPGCEPNSSTCFVKT